MAAQIFQKTICKPADFHLVFVSYAARALYNWLAAGQIPLSELVMRRGNAECGERSAKCEEW